MSANSPEAAKMHSPAKAAAQGLSGYDALGLAALIRAGQVTTQEVIEDAIRRIEQANPKINAIIHETCERARKQASEAAHDRPFAGVPFLAKDNAAIAGVRLTRGSRALRNNIPERTAPLFAAAESAGLILLGVTNMPELGLVDGTESALYGPTRSPWNLDYSPGGSSGGSAAAVAAGLVPLAHATDGGGSTRIPASHCGIFGFKPSRGRLRPGRFTVLSPWPRFVDACLSRSVRDCAMYLSVLEDPDTALSTLGYVSHASSARLRIAVMHEGMSGQKARPEVSEAIADTARLCVALGHRVEQAKLPFDQARLAGAADRMLAIEAARAVDAIAASNGITKLDDGFESRALGLRARALESGSFDAQIAAALPILQQATCALDRFFKDWDVLLTPVAREPVFKIGLRDQSRLSFEALDSITRDYASYTSLHNICGTPAMSVPLHWDSRGLPIGTQFAARVGAEQRLLSLAYELEEARPWAGKRPAIFAK